MLYSLQFLRAFAVFAVLWVHAFDNWGGIGVDIFFIISGFIMLYIIKEKKRNPFEFMSLRIIRILPMYWLMTFIFIVLGLSLTELSMLNIIKSLFFIELGAPILRVGWTLQYEFFLYLICSIALFLSYKFTSYFIVIFLLVSSLIVDIFLFPERAYGHFLEFIFGIILYYMYISTKSSFRFSKKAYFGIFLIGFFISIFTYSNFFNELGLLQYRFLTFGIPALIMVYAVLFYEKHYEFKLNNFLFLIANSSYSIYLSHRIFYDLFMLNITRSTEIIQYYVYGFFLIFVGLTLGILVYKFIEIPLLNYLKNVYFSSSLLSKIKNWSIFKGGFFDKLVMK